jgi:hypothetical protein
VHILPSRIRAVKQRKNTDWKGINNTTFILKLDCEHKNIPRESIYNIIE